MRNWGIKKRVLVLAILPAFLVSVLLAGYLIFTQLRDLEETLSERGFALVRHLGTASEYGVFSGSSNVLKPIVASVMAERDVRSVRIANRYGETLAAAGTPGYGVADIDLRNEKPTRVIAPESNSLVFNAPILRSEFVIDQQLESELEILGHNGSGGILFDDMQERVIGWITVEFDRSQTINRRNQMILNSILLTLGVLIISVVLAARLGRDVTQPIMVLTDAVRRVESGDLKNSIAIRTGGELGKLASGMNAMIAALQTAQTELQKRVDQATAKYREALSLLERKNIELDNARKQAEAASDAKSEFLANVSHEIRNPLNGVLGFVKLLAGTGLNQQQNDYLHTIDVSAKSLLRIISDLLDLSRIEAGKMSLDYRVFSVREMLSDIIALHKPAVAEKGLQFKLDIDTQLPELEEGDPVRIGQVLSNLIGNAIKFTSSGEIKVSCRVRENVKRRLVLEFAVADTGQGIEPVHQSLVYESFYQVDGSTRRQYGGVGLGLAIAKKLIEMMGGRISLQSIPDKGTTITFTAVLTVPVEKDRHDTIDAIPAARMEKMISITGAMEVLVVDDNEINRNLSSILMNRFGVRVDEADSACSAIEKARHRQYDLILMDVHMPQMDGIEATRKIRSMGKPNERTPIVALTADIVADRRRHFLASGMNDYLAKPIEEHALVSIFLKWCPDKARPGSLLREKSIGRLDTAAGIEEMPVLDTALGLRYSSGTDAVWKKSLSLLVKKLHNDTAVLDELTVGGMYRQIAEIAHGIKGSAKYCGAVKLAKNAEELEMAAQDSEQSRVRTAAGELISAAGALGSYIKQHYPDVDTEIETGDRKND